MTFISEDQFYLEHLYVLSVLTVFHFLILITKSMWTPNRHIYMTLLFLFESYTQHLATTTHRITTEKVLENYCKSKKKKSTGNFLKFLKGILFLIATNMVKIARSLDARLCFK